MYPSISAILVGAGFCISTVLLLFVDLPSNSLFWNAVQNSGHTPVFAALTLLCLLLLSTWRASPSFSLILSILFATSLFGLAIELVQGAMGRAASKGDVLRNLVGTAVGFLLYAGFVAQKQKRILRNALIGIAICILLLNFRNPVKYAVANIFEPSLPKIADFEYVGARVKLAASGNAKFQIVKNSKKWPANESKFLQVQFRAGTRTGISILEPHADWADFDNLVFRVFNPSSPAVTAVLRVHDRFHNNEVSDRFRQRLSVPPGESTITLSVDHIRKLKGQNSPARELDLSKIKGVMIFMSSPNTDIELLFDDFHLE